MIPLGDRLRELRDSHGYRQQDVAGRLGIGISTYRRYEGEDVLPKTKELLSLANLYNLSVDELLGIGTVMTFQYDQDDIKALRAAVESKLPTNEKAKAIKDVLVPLLKERDRAFAPPDLSEQDLHAGRTVRTVRFNPSDDKLVMDALMMLSELFTFRV